MLREVYHKIRSGQFGLTGGLVTERVFMHDRIASSLEAEQQELRERLALIKAASRVQTRRHLNGHAD